MTVVTIYKALVRIPDVAYLINLILLCCLNTSCPPLFMSVPFSVFLSSELACNWLLAVVERYSK